MFPKVLSQFGGPAGSGLNQYLYRTSALLWRTLCQHYERVMGLMGQNIFGHSFTNSSSPRWVAEPDIRGTFSILSTCIVTLVLCVWTAIHLNVPGHKEGAMKLYMRKCGWMLLGLLIPELIAYTAFRQHQQARNIAGEINSSDGWGYPSSVFAQDNDDEALPPAEEKSKRRSRFLSSWRLKQRQNDTEASTCNSWTITHGFLAVMGGFALEMSNDDRDHRSRIRNFFPTRRSSGIQRTRLTITARGLACLKNNGYGHLIPTCSLEHIWDKSKGNTMTKTLVCIQASWFCIQCLTRFAQGLAISLLELNTFGHAICTLFIYIMWWHKPLDIAEPETIFFANMDNGPLSLSRLIAAMCVRSELDGVAESAHFYEQEKAFAVNVEYTYSEATQDVTGSIVWDEKVPSDVLVSALSLPRGTHEHHKPGPTANYELALTPSPFASRYLYRRHNGLLAMPISHNLLQTVRLSPQGEVEVLGAGEQSSGAWIDVRHILNAATPDTSTTPLTVPSLPHVRLQIAHSDIRRWQLALGYGRLNSVAKNLLVDRVRNLPLHTGTYTDCGDRYITFYVGFGLFGLIYGGLHCVAWNAPFVFDLERILWRVSSVAIACTTLLLVFLSIWTRFPPFWLKPAKMVDLTVEVYEALNLFYGGKIMRVLDGWVGRSRSACEDAEGAHQNSLQAEERKRQMKERSRNRLEPFVLVPLGVAVRGMLAALIVLQVVAFFLVKICYDLAVTGLLALYVLARSYLVIISFVNLAHLPDSAYVVPNWSRYVPYIG